jgi:hypothetical protein
MSANFATCSAFFFAVVDAPIVRYLQKYGSSVKRA